MLAHYQAAIQKYRQRVFSFAFYSLRVREDAEDITQDVFIRLWQHWPKIDQERLGSWLMRVAHNAIVDQVRKRQTRGFQVELEDCPELSADDANGVGQDLAEMESQYFRQHLERAVAALGDPYRSILVMRDVQGLSYSEIEQALELNQSQVKVYLHRARRQLRDNPELRKIAVEAAIVKNAAFSSGHAVREQEEGHEHEPQGFKHVRQ